MLSRLLSLALVPLIAAQVVTPPPQTYVNTAVARTVELGGATTLVTTQFNVKALADSPGPYHLALAGEGDVEPAWWEVAKSNKPIEGVHLLDQGVPTVQVPLGTLKEGDTATFSLSYLLVHASEPLPAAIAQTDPQYLLWKTNSTYVDSWYPSDVERIKIRAPVANILSHSSAPTTYTRDSTTTKSGAALTLGPFHSVPPTLSNGKVQKAKQEPFSVHYETKEPVLGIRQLRRSAEVSHWGANLNIQDDISLFNNGPALKGHFSRLAHMQSRFHAGTPAQILSEVTLRLPTLAHSPYYYDVIGNVSTSHFRSGAGRVKRPSTLELKPRYPLLGGWNYTFTIGYDQPLGDSLKSDNGKYVLAVPFLTPLKDVVVDEAEVTIVLPEGVSNVRVHTPFKVDSITHSTHKTYLDSTGHHAVKLTKSRCTEHHAGVVYVTYDYSLLAQLQKPFTAAAAVASIFIFAMAVRRVDFSISK